jgi:hypothetical protein
MIPSYSPQARGRSERNFQTWQGRLPQELRLHGIRTLDDANAFLRRTYIREFNRKFAVPAAQPGTAFLRTRQTDLDQVFSIQLERVVNRDNTVSWARRSLQIEKTSWRGTLAGCRVIVCEHLDGRLSMVYGLHRLGFYTSAGEPLPLSARRQQGPSRTPSLPISAPESALGLLPSSEVTRPLVWTKR